MLHTAYDRMTKVAASRKLLWQVMICTAVVTVPMSFCTLQAARQTAEERLQAAEATMSYQAFWPHMPELQLTEPASENQPGQLVSAHSLRDAEPAGRQNPELSRCASASSLKPTADSAQDVSAEQEIQEVLPLGTTQKVTNPLFTQQDCAESSPQVPGPHQGLTNPSMAQGSAHSIHPGQSQASENCDEGIDPNVAEQAVAAQALSPSTSAEQQLQQQIQSLNLQLSTKASELQTSEAATEYVQRLLNAVSGENRDLRKQLDHKQRLLHSASEVQHSSSFLAASAKSHGEMAEHVTKGLASGLQAGTSQIAALWAISPTVRRSLLSEYGTEEPYVGPSRTLEGAESLLDPPALDLTESYSDSISGLSRQQRSDSGHIESLSQVLRRLSQQGAESSSPPMRGGFLTVL